MHRGLWKIVMTMALGGVTSCAGHGGGLAAYYNFDEGSGAVLREHSGNGNNCAVHGGRWVKNGDGYALELDGKKDYVDCGKNESLNLRRSFSIELWIFPQWPPLVGRSQIVGNLPGYGLTYGNYGGTPSIFLLPLHADMEPFALVNPEEWQHIVGTFDEGIIRMYLNGREIYVAGDPEKQPETSGHLMIGARWQEAGGFARNSFFKGRL